MDPILPAELVDAILEQVGNDIDVEAHSVHFASTLLDCSLVSSHFRETAQKLLFNNVAIHFPDSEDKHSMLKKALISSERLRTFVKELSVVVYPTVVDESHVSLPIPTLPNLTRLKIDGGRKWNSLSNWDFMHTKGCGSDILKMIRAPSLRTLEIGNIEDFPLAILSNCHHLEELSVDSSLALPNVTDTTNAHLSMPAFQQGYLKKLDFQNYTFPDFVNEMTKQTSPLSIVRLQELRVSIQNQATRAALQTILRIAAPYLIYLEISFQPPFELSWETLSLPNPGILRNVIFSPTSSAHLWRIISFLEETPESNQLTSIRIVGTILSSSSEFVNETIWHRLDEALTRDRHASKLRYLELDSRGYRSLKLKDKIRTLLPRSLGTFRVVVKP